MINYDREMQNVIASFSKTEGKKPKLLLHACCAPCSSAVIERLKDVFDVTVYYYNPNIDTADEYTVRAEELKRLCKAFSLSAVIEKYDPEIFYETVKGYEDLPEGDKRCFLCYELRLKYAAKYAKEHNFDYFTTTLTISPLKNAEKLNAIGYKTQEEFKVKFLPSDFKKRNGYYRSIELSKEYGLYRQNYCGCVFSKNKNVL